MQNCILQSRWNRPEPYDDEDIKEYEDNGDKFLIKERVIITYSREDEDKVARLLKKDSISKVVYDITEIEP